MVRPFLVAGLDSLGDVALFPTNFVQHVYIHSLHINLLYPTDGKLYKLTWNLRIRFSIPVFLIVFYSLMVLFRVRHKFEKLCRDLSKSRIALTMSLVLIVVLSIYVVRSYPRISCPVDGGNWTLVGMAQVPACVYLFPDGGKPCHSSDECEGGCINYDIPPAGQPIPSVGVYRYDTNGFGCFAIIEDGYYICTD